jgi:hypothetical protein
VSKQKAGTCRPFIKPSDGLEPSTPSFATQFFLQIDTNEFSRVRREASRVSFLMCPFCVRAQSSVVATTKS